MKLFNKLKAWWKEWRYQRTQTVPPNYLRGFRRLANTKEDIVGHEGACYSCKHSVAYVTWWCDRGICKWEACYSRDTITKKDYKVWEPSIFRAGGWTDLPPSKVIAKG